MKLPYQASAYQDRFVAHLLNFKRNGFFLDIGSCHAESCNNTWVLEKYLDWNGICIEKDSQHNESYQKRICQYLNEDALKIDYTKLLANCPKKIDYLSLDIDQLSTIILHLLPFDKHDFNIITVEHDEYLHGDIYRNEQRDILTTAGYFLLCPDVLVPLADNVQPNWSFEDWWIKNVPISPTIQMRSRMYPKEIIAKF